MKTTNKNTITVLIIIFAGIFITSCDSCMPEPNPLKYLYIPDSLKFPMQTGDTAVFMVRNDSIRYDTAVIKVDSSMEAIVENSELTGYSQSISVAYIFYREVDNVFYYMVTEVRNADDIDYIKRSIHFEYWFKNHDGYLCSTGNISNSILIENILLGNNSYFDLYYSPECINYNEECYYKDIYRNIENGLIACTNVSTQDTFILYKYIPITKLTK
ncbi:MAG: hypothetical protein U9Q83_12180 [Bacteroidota bacterium]|nr:hypothetical protein [Bacteroidota bacterium]